jgi:CDP-6-deoxy-D-xylo-4-hexulose-3-dehydrase
LRGPSKQLAAGPKVAEFEERIAEMFGMAHGVMCNSGSSANLLALASLNLPPGSKVLTPALTFATTVAPIVQLGLTPVFVDVEPDTYVLAANAWEWCDAALVPLLLGNTPACVDDGYPWSVPLVVDACDTLGPVLPHAGIVTTSFYASHIITAMGGGGMACFYDGDRATHARLLANWGRASTLIQTDDIGRRMTDAGLGYEYDAKFLFTEVGYNMQATEAQAAFGLAQLESFDWRMAHRRIRFEHLMDVFHPWSEFFVLPKSNGTVNWLAFPLTVRESAPFTRAEFVRHLEAYSIQTRPIMAGNILRQPAFRHLGDASRYPVADSVMRGGLLIGCHQGLTSEHIEYVQEVATSFLRARTGVTA